jgi:Kinesin motor domain
VLDYLFASGKRQFDLCISFLEIYNDQVTDLLALPEAASVDGGQYQSRSGSMTNRSLGRPQASHHVKENHVKGVYVEGLSEHVAHTVDEAMVMFLYGLQRRKMFATVKNQESSRSHTIFQIKLCSPSAGGGAPKVISKFSLVDLAGSERLSEGEKTVERIEEAKYINKSLSALGNVISALKHMHLIKENPKR